MDGRGSTNDLVGALASWNTPQPDIRIYYANPINLDWANPSYDTGWQMFGPGFSVPPGFTGTLPSTRFGPELAFARNVANTLPNRTVAIIKVSQGGTSLSGDWKPSTGYMYRTLTNTARVALQSLTNDGATFTLRGMIWHQGEGDGSSSTATYQARLADFIAAVRRDFGVANLPVVVGELATNRSLTVRQAQFNVAETVPYVGFASSSNLVTLAPDDPHFNSAGALIMGQRMASALEIPPVRLLSIGNTGGTLKIVGSGLANSRCRLVSATNVALPFRNWTTVASNVFGANGEVTFLQPIGQQGAGGFYSIVAD
jgi:iduronate 2-sulfatase